VPQRYKKRKINGKTFSTHRLVYEEAHGPIPEGYLVHHRGWLEQELLRRAMGLQCFPTE
jgi:hypothetical protein